MADEKNFAHLSSDEIDTLNDEELEIWRVQREEFLRNTPEEDKEQNQEETQEEDSEVEETQEAIEEIEEKSPSNEPDTYDYGADLEDDDEAEEEKPVKQESTQKKEKQLEQKETQLGSDEAAKLDAYDKVFGVPIKANGTSIVINTPEDAIKLIQLGANYYKKQEEIKPHLATIKMLEKAEFTDPNKLQYAMDLVNGDKGAIRKLLKDIDYDAYDDEGDEVNGYTPKPNIPSAEMMSFEETLNDISSSPNFSAVNDFLKDWDNKSWGEIVKQPAILRDINTLNEQGVLPMLIAEFTKAKMLGNAPGMSDLDLFAATFSNYQAALKEQQPAQAQVQRQVTNTTGQTGQSKSQQDPKATAQKRASMSNAARSSRPANTDNSGVDPAKPLSDQNLSEEEYRKLFRERYGDF